MMGKIHIHAWMICGSLILEYMFYYYCWEVVWKPPSLSLSLSLSLSKERGILVTGEIDARAESRTASHTK
jgi:hypothetical protein